MRSFYGTWSQSRSYCRQGKGLSEGLSWRRSNLILIGLFRGSYAHYNPYVVGWWGPTDFLQSDWTCRVCLMQNMPSRMTFIIRTILAMSIYFDKEGPKSLGVIADRKFLLIGYGVIWFDNFFCSVWVANPISKWSRTFSDAQMIWNLRHLQKGCAAICMNMRVRFETKSLMIHVRIRVMDCEVKKGFLRDMGVFLAPSHKV
jgi:hypothetical protein